MVAASVLQHPSSQSHTLFASPAFRSSPFPLAALVASDIMRAVNSLGPPNERDAMAVDARQEIDLRIGAAFTRLQTLLLQNKFDWSGLLPAGRERMLLSYGPCQFPTLGLIVQRLWWVEGGGSGAWGGRSCTGPAACQGGCTLVEGMGTGRSLAQMANSALPWFCNMACRSERTGGWPGGAWPMIDGHHTSSPCSAINPRLHPLSPGRSGPTSQRTSGA